MLCFPNCLLIWLLLNVAFANANKIPPNAVVLTMEEVNNVRCMGTPFPYSGAPQLEDVVSDMFVAANDKYTYYIFPKEKIIRVNNKNSKDRECSGVFKEINNDNKELVFSYVYGDYCSGHRMRSTKLFLHCDRSISSFADIESVIENTSCESHIHLRTPTLCMISPPRPKEEDPDVFKQYEAIQQSINHIREMIHALREQIRYF